MQLRVTAISPGAVRTEFQLVRHAGDEAPSDSMYKGIEPLTGEDIADDVVYAATRYAALNARDELAFVSMRGSAMPCPGRLHLHRSAHIFLCLDADNKPACWVHVFRT